MGASKRRTALPVIAAGLCAAGAVAQLASHVPPGSSPRAAPSAAAGRALSGDRTLPLGGGGAGGGLPDPCPEDINSDGAINVLDLIELLLCFGQPAIPTCDLCTEQDINDDGVVNVLDLIELLLSFGQDCPDSNCQFPDNTGHGAAGTLAAVSTCTPGSAPGNENAFWVADDFNIDVDTVVDHVQWWGIYIDFVAGGVNCGPGPAVQTFEISYYDNTAANDCPGTLLGNFLVDTSPVDTGRLIAGVPVFEYDTKHPSLTLLGGQCYWLSIRLRVDLTVPAGDPFNNCSWLWQTAGDPPDIGNGRSVQAGDGITCVPASPAPWVCPRDVGDYDLAWCLQGPGAGGKQEPIELGDPSLCFTSPPEPPNNLCSNRLPLTEPGIDFTTIGATTDGPPGAAGCTRGCGPHKDIWYNYSAAIDGLLTVTTCDDLGGTADFDTTVALYDGCECDPATGEPIGPQIGCNDEDPVNRCGGAPAFQSTLSVPVVAGQCYKVQLGGFSADEEGSGFLAVNCEPADKDSCFGAEDATPPTGGSVKINNDTSAFAADAAPACSDQVTGLPLPLLANGVWYSVIGDGTTLTATTCSDRTLYDSALSVYCGPCTELFCVGANDDDPSCTVRPLASTVTWCSAPGQEYLILVHGASAADTGPFGLTVSSDGSPCDPPAPCEHVPACDLVGDPNAACYAENTDNASNMDPEFFRTAEDFTPLADGTVTSGCVWVITLDFGTTHDLTVTYYDNDPATNLPDESGGMGVGIAGPFSQSGGTLTVTGPTFVPSNTGFVVQELKFEHAGVALAGGQCYWVEITDATPGLSAFWEWGSGGNSYFVQDGRGVAGLPDGYDPSDAVDLSDLRFCLDIVFDESACGPVLPVNDACADRAAALDGLNPFTTLAAMTDGLPSNGTGDCVAFGDPQIHNDVWFNYTATASGTLTVSTCNDGNPPTGDADYDTKIGIYDGCATVDCPYGGNEIGCNDDGAGCAGFTSVATAPVVAGNCYKIRVGGFGAFDSGNGNLAVSVGP